MKGMGLMMKSLCKHFSASMKIRMNLAKGHSMGVARIFLLANFCLISLSCVRPGGRALADRLEEWPDGSNPLEIGRLVANRFVESPYGGYGRTASPTSIAYPEVCTWYGALTFARLSDDSDLQTRLIRRFAPLLAERKDQVPRPNHVDNTVFAAVPLEIYMLTRDERYLAIGKGMADRQWGEPGDSADSPYGPASGRQQWDAYRSGLTWQTRMWIDDMYMITAAQVQAYRATDDRIHLDRAARQMIVYLDSLQQPNGLFYHSPETPFFWGRGNGWVAAGLTELLRSLREDHEHRGRIMSGYRTMMDALLNYQHETGMWHQLIDDRESWLETSCTGMFAFAFITGVKKGWLDSARFGQAARRAWTSLMTYIDDNGDVREVCEGTGKKNDRQYYLDRKRNVGDMHGQAPVLWCASAFLER